jgi:hypothetical protein
MTSPWILSRSRASAVCLLLALLTGCAGQVRMQPSDPRLERYYPNRLHVTLRSGEMILLSHLTVQKDSLVGTARGGTRRGRTSIALAEVERVEARPGAAERTIGVGVIAAMLAWLALEIGSACCLST